MRLKKIILIFLAAGLPIGCGSGAVNQKIEDAREIVEISEAPNSPTQKEIDAAKHPCDDEQTPEGMEQCARKELEKANAEMNRIYENVSANIGKGGAQAAQQKDEKLRGDYQKDLENLKNTQKAWLAYLDANCETEKATHDEAANAALAFLLCRHRLTEQRTDELKLIYQFIYENK